jgi:hypothetical protein
MKSLLRSTILLLSITFVGGCGDSTTQPPIECDPADTSCNPVPGPGGETPAPLSVSQVTPADGATDVARSAAVTVTFSRPVAEASVNSTSFSLGSVDGSRTVSGSTVTFTPASELTDGFTYTLSVNGVTDTAGVGLAAAYTSSFTTERVQVSADAGADFDATKATSVTLNSGSSGGTGATLTWTQISGPDVGTLSGDSPTFTAPDDVTVLGFELAASDGTTTEVDSVRVWVLEDADQAIWVSASGSSSNPGTREAPLGSIQEAIDAADNAGNGADVYVASGAYSETLTLRSRVSVYGGFDGATWERDLAGPRPVVSGESVAVVGNAANNLTIEGMEIVAADATEAGGSSIAVLLDDSNGVRLVQNILRAGAGAAGVAGASPGGRARAGSDGSVGGAARLCVSRTSGGARGVNYRDGGTGGLGGGTNPTGGSNAEARSSGGGGGGAAGTNSSRNGRPGGDATSNGSAGSNGRAGDAFGSVDADGNYIADAAAAGGGRGGTGYGGGGGGGAHGFVGFCGGSGGGGGGGGEGGAGASPGTGGGASFAVLLVGLSVAEIADNDLQTSVGGAGGNGGSGQLGGFGGGGARGGVRGCDSLIPSICTGTGGTGGDGSTGGRGGHGGGGGGGPSIAVVEGPDASTSLSGNVITLGDGGAGGSSLGNDGPTGESADYKKIN